MLKISSISKENWDYILQFIQSPLCFDELVLALAKWRRNMVFLFF